MIFMADSRAQNGTPLGSGASFDPPADLVEIARVVGAHGVRGWIKIQPFSPDSTVLNGVKKWWIGAAVRPLDELQSRLNSNVQADQTLSEKTSSSSSVSQGLRRVDVVWARVHGASWLANIKGLADRDDAQALKGSSIWVSRADFPSLDPDEFYWIDLIGCDVYSQDFVSTADQSSAEIESGLPLLEQSQSHPESLANGMRLGVVDSVVDNPAHPLLSILRQRQDVAGSWVPEVNAKGNSVYTLIPFVVNHVPVVDIANRRILVDWPSDF